jgi:tetratricopeptide (TPR) repeat protein
VKHFFFLFFFISILSFSQEEKRLALVIGNSNYDVGELKNPVNDAKLIAKTLDSLGFDTMLATNLIDQRSLLTTIREFGNKRTEYDVGFVYYAGHGVQIEGENYLLPTKEVYESENDIEDFAVNVSKIMKYLTAMTNQVNILILDACRDNPFEKNWNATRSIKGKGLAKIPPPTGSLIAFSTDAGNTAADGDSENSIYCMSLAKNMLLENTTLDQVFRNVRTDVLKDSNGEQRPIEYSQLTGEAFYLVKSDFTKIILEIEDLVERNSFFDALELSSSLIEKNPVEISYKIRGDIYSKMNNHQRAISDYLSCLKINPKNLDVLFNIGRSYYYSSNFKESVDYLSKCIDLDCSADAYMYRARSYDNLDKEKFKDQIVADWRRYQELLPLSPYANYGLARKLTLSNDRIKYLEKAIELEIKFKTSTKVGLLKNTILLTEASYFLGQEYIKIKKYEKAIEIVEKGIEINPEDEQGYINKFEFMIGYNFYDNRTLSSVQLLSSSNDDIKEKINELSFNNPEAAKYLAGYYRKVGKFDKALEIIDRAILLDPEDSSYKFQKGSILLGLREYHKAIEIYKRLLMESKSYGSTINLSLCYYYLADQYFDNEEYDLSMDYNKKATELITVLIKETLTDKDQNYRNAVNHLRLQNFYDQLAEIYEGLEDEINKIYYIKKKEEILLQGINLYPDIYPPLYFLLGTYYSDELENCENCEVSELNSKSINYYEKTIELNPLYNRAYFGLYFAHLRNKDFKKAKESINKVIKIIDFNQSGFYNYKIAYLLHFKEYEECLILIDEMNDFFIKNGYKAPASYSSNFAKYFEPLRKARISHLKSYIYYTIGKEFESIIEISKSINIISEIYNSDFSVQEFYTQPHSTIGDDYGNGHTYENDKIFMLTYFDNEDELYKFNFDPIDRDTFYNLFIIRANLFMELGLQDKACEDYKNALKFTKKNSEDSSKIEDLISENCI